jgi:hypothetical protein
LWRASLGTWAGPTFHRVAALAPKWSYRGARGLETGVLIKFSETAPVFA